MTHFDVIVLGVGGVGSAVAWHVAKRGHSVLGLDRFPPGHDRGSSHGQTRIIRKAYFEHPDYVPLLHRAYELWAELEAQCGQQLYFPTGLIEIGSPDGIVLPGVRASAQRFQLEIDALTAADVTERFPGFVVPDDCEVVFERDAGFLLVEPCVQQHARAAEQAGAVLRSDVSVQQWSANERGVRVVTSDETIHGDRLVVTAGAGAVHLLDQLGVTLRVLRKHLHWYPTEEACYGMEQGCPAFFYESGNDYYYGFPQIDARGVKVAEHSRGTEVGDLLNDDRAIESDEKERVDRFVANCLSKVNAAQEHAVCYYTMSPDEHFIVDRHPAHERVTLAAGLSGHGFKFTSVLGEVLADLALDGATRHPIDFLSCSRFPQ